MGRAVIGNRSTLPREQLTVDVLPAARLLLGCHLVADRPEGEVVVRLVEVEAYRGADDPAAHSYRGRTARNGVMFGPPGHLYVYFVYGMHFCANISCLSDGEPGAVLMRAAEVISDIDVARLRRPTARSDDELARGPARLATLLGLRREHDGLDLIDPTSPVRLLPGDPVPAEHLCTGPRVGVAAAQDRPWRFWVHGSPAVSAYRRRKQPARPSTVGPR